MDKKKNNRKVELNYEFDRLGFKKMSMVYTILVPTNSFTSPIQWFGEVLA